MTSTIITHVIITRHSKNFYLFKILLLNFINDRHHAQVPLGHWTFKETDYTPVHAAL